MLKSVDNYRVEIMLTLAMVMGGYALASAIHISGPIAVVVAGLFIGNHGRSFAMSDTTRQNLDTVFLAGLLAIPVILLARWVSVALPVAVLSQRRKFMRGTVAILTWGGLRGGISVALALSLPAGSDREIVLAITYIIVVFSILVQGLTLNRVVRRLVH